MRQGYFFDTTLEAQSKIVQSIRFLYKSQLNKNYRKNE